jgi:large subunit ribosomal protein L7/L12
MGAGPGAGAEAVTSPPEQIQIDCPKCGTVYQDWYRPSINATLDPELAADEEYMRQASTGTCPACGHTVDIGTLIAEWG